MTTFALSYGSKNTVVAKTFQLLGFSMIPTILAAYAMSLIPVGVYAENKVATMVLSIVALLAGFGLMYFAARSKNENFAVVALMAFAGIMGATMGPLLSSTMTLKNGSTMILNSAVLTLGTFASLTIYAYKSKKDFSFMGGFLFAGLIVLVLTSIVGILVSSSALQLTIAAFGAILFAGYMLYDVSRVLNGGETNPVFAAMSIYLDIINFFTSILRLFVLSDD